jgi:endonuclease-3 related protein
MLRRVFSQLLQTHGQQHWWPADDPFEVLVGALLVQRTAWRNVEQAIHRLREAGAIDSAVLASYPLSELEHLIRPAGFFRTKAGRLQGLARVVTEAGGITAMAKSSTTQLRQQLLSISGVGPETADAILLYAFERPVLVVDAYLRRLIGRCRGQRWATDDTRLRRCAAQELKHAAELNEFHALVVAHGKRICRPQPCCGQCCLQGECRHYQQSVRNRSVDYSGCQVIPSPRR